MEDLEHALPNRPDTVAGWRAAADSLLSPPCCAFHRNNEITARYAWLHTQQPTCFKWAGMAAIASHHARLVLFPFRLNADRSGWVNLPRSLSQWRLLTRDANKMREVNNAIYHDICWVHLAYLASPDGLSDLRQLLGPYPQHTGLLSAFETIDRGRTILADQQSPEQARQEATDLIWAGNLALLRHEQQFVVQPLFDDLSGTFARLISMGATTTFEVRGLRRQIRYVTSFSGYSLTGGLMVALKARAIPRITRFEDRWVWLEARVVPRFRRLDADRDEMKQIIARVVQDTQRYANVPCLVPA